jgi:hypothetical protein
MEPLVIRKPQMTLVGISVFGVARAEMEGAWQRFDPLEDRILRPMSRSRFAIVTWGIESELSGKEKEFLFIGTEVQCIAAPPLDSVIKILPAGIYAMLTVRAALVVWEPVHIFEQWLPDSGFTQRGFLMQRYDRARFFDCPPNEREVDVFLPLRKTGL